MQVVPVQFYEDSVSVGHPIAIEPEIGGDAASLLWDTMGWGYWDTPFIPVVDKWKFLVPNRMTNVCNRSVGVHAGPLRVAPCSRPTGVHVR